MKVKELIEQLQLLDQDSIVVISGYEGGVDEVSSAEETTVALNVNSAWYYGKHEVVENGYDKAKYPSSSYKSEKAIHLK